MISPIEMIPLLKTSRNLISALAMVDKRYELYVNGVIKDIDCALYSLETLRRMAIKIGDEFLKEFEKKE